MYGLAYVLIPGTFDSLQSELDRTLAPFQRGSEDAFPREKLAFDDATDELADMHRGKFRYGPGRSVDWLGGGDGLPLFYLTMSKLDEYMAACGLDAFEGTFAELEPDFDAFVRRFTKFDRRDPDTFSYGRWLNPIGYWDWWELGGRFNGAITGERRPGGAEQFISSGPNSGRTIIGNLVSALGARTPSEEAEIEDNVELIASLGRAADRAEAHAWPTALVLPMGCCANEDRWFDNVGWHEIKAGTRAFLGVPGDADYRQVVRAAYQRFDGLAAAGVAYHF